MVTDAQIEVAQAQAEQDMERAECPPIVLSDEEMAMELADLLEGMAYQGDLIWDMRGAW